MLKTAIFINDYLLLLDFLSKIEEEFPLLEYTVFGDLYLEIKNLQNH